MSGWLSRRPIPRSLLAAAVAITALPGAAVSQSVVADHEPVPVSRSSGMLQTGYESFSVADLGDLKTFNRSGWTARVVRPISIGGWHFAVGLSHSQIDYDLVYDGRDAFVRFADQARVSRMHIEVAPPGELLVAHMGLVTRHSSDPGARWSAGIRLNPLRTVTLGLDHDDGRELLSEATAMYDGEGGAVTLASQTHRSQWHVWWSPGRDWRLRTQLVEWIVAGTDTYTSEFTITPTGRALLRGIRVDRAWGHHGHFSLTFNSLDLAGRLDAYTTGRNFGQFGIIRAAGELWRAGYHWNHRSHQLGIALARGEGSAYLAGVVKAWPFTEGLADLLGQRRHLVIDGRLTWWQLRLTATQRHGAGVTWFAQSDFYRLSPELKTTTWQPLFLGAGIDDLRGGRLDITGAYLARAQAGLGLPLTRQARLNLIVRQWIPLRITRHHQTVSETAESTTSETSARSASGGTELSARIVVPL